MSRIDISKPESEGGWGINESNSAIQNSQKFNDNIANGQELLLPGGIYDFKILDISEKDDVEFYGESDTVIKFSVGHSALVIADADKFNIHDLNFDGRETPLNKVVFGFMKIAQTEPSKI